MNTSADRPLPKIANARTTSSNLKDLIKTMLMTVVTNMQIPSKIKYNTMDNTTPTQRHAISGTFRMFAHDWFWEYSVRGSSIVAFSKYDSNKVVTKAEKYTVSTCLTYSIVMKILQHVSSDMEDVSWPLCRHDCQIEINLSKLYHLLTRHMKFSSLMKMDNKQKFIHS